MPITSDHWLARARRLPSPNWDHRPDMADIALVVLHGISLPPGQFGGEFVEAFFMNQLDVTADPSFADLQGVRVSAHLFISRGGRVTQFVPFHHRAWHAGRSNWQGRQSCNDFSVGIELEGTDTRPYTARQYHSLSRVVRELLTHYPRLHPGAIVSHAEIAPDRKTDPGPSFDWSRLLETLRSPSPVGRRR